MIGNSQIGNSRGTKLEAPTLHPIQGHKVRRTKVRAKLGALTTRDMSDTRPTNADKTLRIGPRHRGAVNPE